MAKTFESGLNKTGEKFFLASAIEEKVFSSVRTIPHSKGLIEPAE